MFSHGRGSVPEGTSYLNVATVPNSPNGPVFVDLDIAANLLTEAIKEGLSGENISIEPLHSLKAGWMVKASFQGHLLKLGPLRLGQRECAVYLEGSFAAQFDRGTGGVSSTNQPTSNGRILYTLWNVPDCVYLQTDTDLGEVLKWFNQGNRR